MYINCRQADIALTCTIFASLKLSLLIVSWQWLQEDLLDLAYSVRKGNSSDIFALPVEGFGWSSREGCG